MKGGLSQAIFCATVFGAMLIAERAVASLAANDSAADAAYNGGWGPGTNGGTGWGGAWTFRNQANTLITTTNGSRGWFTGNSLGNNFGEPNQPTASDEDINTPTSGGRAWGLYSNTGGTDQIYAIRPFSGALNVGDTVSWYMDNGNIDPGQVVGVRLLSDSNDVNSRVFEVRFVGGDSFYTLVGTPNQTSTIGFTRQGVLVEYSLTGTNTFSVKLTRLANNVSQTITGANVNANAIMALAFKNQLAGNGGDFDGFFNSISVSPVPEASAIWLCSLTIVYLARRSRRPGE
jgi:hypothetical protein